MKGCLIWLAVIAGAALFGMVSQLQDDVRAMKQTVEKLASEDWRHGVEVPANTNIVYGGKGETPVPEGYIKSWPISYLLFDGWWLPCESLPPGLPLLRLKLDKDLNIIGVVRV